MKKTYMALLAVAFMATGCTNNEQFRVNGTIEGDPTINLRVAYYADGAYRTQITAAREGEFEFFGSARQPAVVEIFDYDYRLLGRLYAANGQTLDVKLARSNPFDITVSGNETARDWADFLRANADSLLLGGEAANAVIARYIDTHRDNLLSTLLLTTTFDSAIQPVLVDSLLAMIEPAARPSALTDGYNYLLQRLVAETAEAPLGDIRYLDRRDSVCTFRAADKAYSIVVMSGEDSWRKDSIIPLLKRLQKEKKDSIAILDIGFEPDFNDWKSTTAPDSAGWAQGWLPGGPAAPAVERLAVPRLPYYVICDSTGAQLCRTPWATVAQAALDSMPR